MNVALAILLYAGVFSVAEFAKRVLKYRSEATRLFVHAVSGVISAAMPLWISKEQIIGIAILFVIVLAFSKKLSLFTSIHGVERKSWGEFFFPVGIGLAALLYLPQQAELYYLSILILALCDPLANIVGTLTQGRKSQPLRKSLDGSFAFFLLATIIGLFFLSPALAVGFGLLVSIVEAFSPYGSDNVTIVLAATIIQLIT